jgi:hypothetical protein
MDKFFKVDDGIYRSARPDDFSLLKDLGIKSRLVLEDFFKNGLVLDSMLHYPMSGFKKPSMGILNFNLLRIEKAPKPLLINCQHGVDRTGIVVAAYRITVNGWCEEKAWEEAQRIGMSKFLWWWKECLKNI